MYQSMHRARPTLKPTLIFAFTSWNIAKLMEKDKLDVKMNQSKIAFRTMHNRGKHLVDFVRAHNGRVSRVDVEEMLLKQYESIRSPRRAYDEVLRLIRNSEHLRLRRGVIEYVP
jgi:hypothetical protein